MVTVTLYTKKNCPACDQVITDLEFLQPTNSHSVVVIDVEDNPAMMDLYGGHVPVVEIGPYRLRTNITRQDLQVALGAAQDRKTLLEKNDDVEYRQRVQRGQKLSGADRFTYWFSKNYMIFINLLLFIYVFLPFLAPILEKAKLDLPARAIYTIYSPLCHQLGFRSWFLFGEQAYYPRSLAAISGEQTYEQVTGLNSTDLLSARNFIGTPLLGYKVAVCERDVAIYGSLLLFGIIFMVTGRRIKQLPWYLWIIFGVIPIAIDGFSQLPGIVQMVLPAWVPLRESTPLLRSITGFMFGFTTGWLIFPMIEQSMRDTNIVIARKMAIISQTPKTDKPSP